MPWTTKDVDEHKKGLTPAQKKKWVSIANGVLEQCQADGGKDCEGKAIRVANSKFSDEGFEMKTENQKVPKAALRLMDSDHPQVKFAMDGEKEKLDMVVYSGGIIKDHWWWGNLAIDLEGLTFGKKKYPILESHDSDRKIGFAGKPIVDKELRINPDTVQFVDTPESLQFRKLSKEGFPFEASMYAQPLMIQRLAEKETAEVNGFTMKGPATIWRKTAFKEASVCVFGWDSNTRSAAFSKDDEMEITLEVQTKSESALADNEGNSSREEGVNMELSELKAKHADLVLAIREEVLAEVKTEKTTLEKTVADLRTQLQQKDATITSQEERVLKLEKSEAIRREKDRVAEADRIWAEKLEASEIPEHLYAKVKSQVGYTRFVKDEILDVENFSKAVDAEVADWVGKGVVKTKIIGGGGLSKETAPEGSTKLAEKEEEDRVDALLAMAGQPIKKS